MIDFLTNLANGVNKTDNKKAESLFSFDVQVKEADGLFDKVDSFNKTVETKAVTYAPVKKVVVVSKQKAAKQAVQSNQASLVLELAKAAARRRASSTQVRSTVTTPVTTPMTVGVTPPAAVDDSSTQGTHDEGGVTPPVTPADDQNDYGNSVENSNENTSTENDTTVNDAGNSTSTPEPTDGNTEGSGGVDQAGGDEEDTTPSNETTPSDNTTPAVENPPANNTPPASEPRRRPPRTAEPQQVARLQAERPAGRPPAEQPRVGALAARRPVALDLRRHCRSDRTCVAPLRMSRGG